MNTLVRLSVEPTQTRVLVTQGTRDIGKAILPPSGSAHPRATATLLEGLSLYMNERLCVVLSVDEWSASSDSLGILDAFGHGERSVFRAAGARGGKRRPRFAVGAICNLACQMGWRPRGRSCFLSSYPQHDAAP
jgi:hypothetical protein